METYELLKKLSNSSGVSGYEARKEEIIREYFQDYVDEIKVDSVGNIICVKKGCGEGERLRILLAAHIDEIGLMIKSIEKDGLLKFTMVGGVDPRTIVSQEVIVHGREDILGVIGVLPPHMSTNTNKAYKMDDLTIDVGMDREEVEKIVRVGDTVTIRRKFMDLKNQRVAGKALDNKAGVAGLLHCAQELSKIKHQGDIYFVMTVQEEETMLGATVASYNIDPDIGIAVDVGFGRTPELPSRGTNDLDGGPSLALGANIHPKLRKELVKVAQNYNIDTQVDVAPASTGTDARVIQLNRLGVPSLCLSIPLRYMHTSVELVSMKDIYSTGKLLAFFIASINNEKLEELLCY